MKKKSLKLNRETVRKLVSAEELDQVQGGIVSSDNMQCMRDKNKTFTSYQN